MVKIKSSSKKVKIIVVLVVLALLTIGVVCFLLINRSHDSLTTNLPVKPVGIVNLNPPTDQEKASGEKAKQKAVEDEQKRNATQPTESGKVIVKPSITYASQYGENIEVGAFVPGIFEQGGKCTLTLAKDGSKYTTTVTSVRGANSVDCPVMTISRSQISAGKWQAFVNYYSSSAAGNSDERLVEVK